MSTEIEKISIGFAGLYANLHLVDGRKVEVSADWYNQKNPCIGDYFEVTDAGNKRLLKPWGMESHDQPND